MKREDAETKFFWVWVTFLALLLFRGDGTFPFPKTMEPKIFRILILFQTIVLTLLFGLIFSHLLKDSSISQFSLKNNHLSFLIVLSYIFIFLLHILQQRRFQEYGYSGNFLILSVIWIASLLTLTVLWKRGKFLAVILSAGILKCYPLLYFPITAKRSDMLPIIQKAGENLLLGENIFQYYLLDNQVWTQMVRFPGMILSYLPATFFQLDLRIILLIWEGLFFWLIYRKWGRSPFFIPGLILLAFFPYWHYRHELYEAPFWVFLLLTIFSFGKKKMLLQIFFLTVFLSSHQWALLFAPFLFIYLSRQQSILSSLSVFVSSAGLAFSVVICLSRGDLNSFLYHTFFYYAQVLREFAETGFFHLPSLYFTPELTRIIGVSGLHLLRIGLQALLWLVAIYKLKKSDQLYTFLACSLMTVLLTNTVAWTYQYLLVAILLWVAALEKERESDFPEAVGDGHAPVFPK